MKVFVLLLSVFFVFDVVISPTYASEEVCTIEPSCTAKIEEEIDILKKKNAKLEKDAEERKGILKDIIKLVCPVYHGNKCFFPVMGSKANYDGGVAICKSFGGHLANIYSQIHMDDVMKYIRENRMGSSGWEHFRLGMKYDLTGKKLTLRDGTTDAPAGLKWYPGAPSTVDDYAGHAGWTNVLLVVQDVQSTTYQYLYNYRPSWTSYVLCEIE